MVSLFAQVAVVPAPRPIPSPIEGVADGAWDALVRALATANIGAVSTSNGLGMFEMRIRRLADLGVVTSLWSYRGTPVPPAAEGRMLWDGRFVPPMTREWWLRNPVAQYRALCDSLVEYTERIRMSALKVPREMADDLSGALGVLHAGGEGALRGKRFPDTEIVYQRAKGLF